MCFFVVLALLDQIVQCFVIGKPESNIPSFIIPPTIISFHSTSQQSKYIPPYRVCQGLLKIKIMFDKKQYYGILIVEVVMEKFDKFGNWFFTTHGECAEVFFKFIGFLVLHLFFWPMFLITMIREIFFKKSKFA